MRSHARPGVFLHHLSCAAAAAEARMRGAEQYLYFYNIRADNSFLVVRHREVIRSVISTSVIQHITSIHPYIMCPLPLTSYNKFSLHLHILELLVFIFMDWFNMCLNEGVLSELHCIHNVGMGTFDLHGLILCGSEGFLSVLFYIHIGNTGEFWAPCWLRYKYWL